MLVSDNTAFLRLIEEQASNVPPLGEKLVVDLVNGLEVSGPHITAHKERGLAARLWESMDGSGNRREAMIAERHQEAITGLLNWTMELTRNIQLSADAIAHVADKLSRTQSLVLKLAHSSVDHGRQLEEHAQLIGMLRSRVENHTERLQDLERDFNAHRHLDRVITGWRAGRLFAGYPALVQAAFALLDIARTEEGRHLCTTDGQHVVDCIIEVLQSTPLQDVGYAPVSRWLSLQEPIAAELVPITEYVLLGGAPEKRPFRHLLRHTGGQRPEWFSELQRQGKVSGFMDMPGFVRHLVAEVRP